MATSTTHGVGNNADASTRTSISTSNKAELNPDSGIDHNTDFDPLLPADAMAIVSSARALLQAADAGLVNAGLKGKQLALMCASDPPGVLPGELSGDMPGTPAKADSQSSDAAFFRLAATGLGAHVANIGPRLSVSSSAAELRRLALMLGRLYDAVECQGMPSDLVQKIRAQAGVPVYANLAGAAHPTALLVDQLVNQPADQLTASTSPSDKRMCLLQAALLRSLGLS